MKEIKIEDKIISLTEPPYFIADIAANHDGDLNRAKELIKLVKDCGGHAAKFQNFQASKIVSDYGFKSLGKQLSHQSGWGKSVFDVYQDASVPFEWTHILKEECDKVGIHYFSSPYDFDAIDMLDDYVPAYKIGSGEIDWLESLERIAKKNKPVFLATGASEINEVKNAVKSITQYNNKLILMQCNTNYTASLDNFNHISLNVLKQYNELFPDLLLGLSDHTPGHTTVLGAITLGARAIEKHFTDNNNRVGPDHIFSMNPKSWEEMILRSNELFKALGSSDKKIADNEKETCIIQRRCIRASVNIDAGEKITREKLDVLRPANIGSISPSRISDVVGKISKENVEMGSHIAWSMLQ